MFIFFLLQSQSVTNTTTSDLDEVTTNSPSVSPTPTHPSNVEDMETVYSDKDIDVSL